MVYLVCIWYNDIVDDDVISILKIMSTNRLSSEDHIRMIHKSQYSVEGCG